MTNIRKIDHPARFKSGSRIIMLKSRYKDGVEDQRTILRVSHSEDQFDREIGELMAMMQPSERIYASAGERDMKKAMRLFKERMLANDYDPDPEQFFKSMSARWTSCLMDVKSQAGKIWLFDCDTEVDADRVAAQLNDHYDRPEPPYTYPSKTGTHIIVQAFDRSSISPETSALIHENAIMLWAYSTEK